MRQSEPFQPTDLAELDQKLLDRAVAVVPMEQVAAGQKWQRVIGLRHDVDNRIEPAVAFAEWEAARGYRSTYFILHTAPYWQDKDLLVRSLDRIAEFGHEIGIHNNALAESYRTGSDPRLILAVAVEELRGYGHDVRGTVAHGDGACYAPDGTVWFVNDELFAECPRPSLGVPRRSIGRLRIEPAPMSEFGLEYDANWLGRGHYLSDSGGTWSEPFDQVADAFPYPDQLHMLVHPDWWGEAFVRQELAA